MKATAYLIENFEQMMQAEKLSLPNAEKPKYVEREFYFVLGAVAFAFLTDHEDKQMIKCFIGGQSILLKYDEPTWQTITTHLKER